MGLLTLLPMGVLQLQAALENGYWYARSAEFMGKPIIDILVWMRVPGDTIFSVGAAAAGLVRDASVAGAPAGAGKSRQARAGLNLADRTRHGHRHSPARSGAAPAGGCAAPPAVLRRRGQRAAGHGVVDPLADRARWHLWQLPQPAIPAGWMHAVVMQYQVLPTFMFGFLLTVFPRWMGLPALTPLALPAGRAGPARRTGADAGRAVRRGAPAVPGPVADAGGLDRRHVRCCWACCGGRSGRPPGTPSAAWPRLLLGLVGLALVFAYLYTGNARLMFAAIKFGGFGLLLPIYFTVSHRMFPFFAGIAVPDYQPWRPHGAAGRLLGLRPAAPRPGADAWLCLAVAGRPALAGH